ncbi:MAG: hypothetical protein JSR80_00890 [Verrucomicrobia bacterium]|nr:hypothetical protein [Verrucomicrobiota bacterium]
MRKLSSISVPQRANQILRFILIGLLVVALKVWQLSILEHDTLVQEAHRPQRRIRIERAQRGTIRDRFNLPLAVNRIQHNAAVSYAQIREVPRQQRGEHIRGLSQMLARELGMEADRIEDLIHSKAALFPNTPYVIASDIDEKTYYRLRMRERQWLGLHAESTPKRYYPRGRVGAEVLGYMGAISKKEYDALAGQLQQLRRAVDGGDEEASLRLQQLQERAYAIDDQIGKAGIEGRFDEVLRGFAGEKIYQQDIYGNYVRQLPGGREPVTGKRVFITLSAELQEFAEQLLAQSEEIREGKSRYIDRNRGVEVKLKQPWIKGGAIVVLEPSTGDVLALASYPRFDPNTFVERTGVDRWFETEKHIGEIWDGHHPLMRERFHPSSGLFFEEQEEISWERYLDFVLPKNGPLREQLPRTIKQALAFQPEESNLLVKDLCNLAVDQRRFSLGLLEKIGHQTLSQYRAAAQAALRLERMLKERERARFHSVEFAAWRQEHGKNYLRQMRLLEKQRKTYQRPYLDYFDRKEEEMFNVFWQEHRWKQMTLFLKEGVGDEQYAQLREAVSSLTPLQTLHYLQTFRSFEELDRPLLGHYPSLRSNDERGLALAFYPRHGFGYHRSWAFRQATPQGSIFKLVTSYAALMHTYDQLKKEGKNPSIVNPLTIVDDPHLAKQGESKSTWNMGFFADGRPIPQRYKGGNLMKTQRAHVGEIDLPGALETSSNSYFGLLAIDHLNDPSDLIHAASALSFGERTGIALPGEYKGSLPADVGSNRTGLYAFVNGQHSLVVTPLQTAVMISAIANGGKIFEPRIVGMVVGKDLLLQPSEGGGDIEKKPQKLVRQVRMPDPVRKALLEGMRLTISGSRGGALPSRMRDYTHLPSMLRDFRKLAPEMVGKSGTAEKVEVIDLDPVEGAHIYNHVWFAAISFKEPLAPYRFPEPELVVVIHLPFGDYGKEAAPLAAQVIKKWREIRANRRDFLEQ